MGSIHICHTLRSMDDMSSQGEISYEVKVEKAKCFMWLRHPEYVVDCLVSAGFDTLPLSADIDEMSLREWRSFVPVFMGSPHIIPLAQ